jgi:glycosyltransferase involved in cell wall biosynthesis
MVSRFLNRHAADVIHAWGPGATAAAIASTRPLLAELFDPQAAGTCAKLIASLSRAEQVAVACSTELIRRRLIENGAPAERSVVIRPGVDFQVINRARRRPVREELGLSRDHRVVIVPPDATRAGNQFEAFWAGSLLNHLDRNVRVLVPCHSRERRRIARFAAALPTENALICPSEEGIEGSRDRGIEAKKSRDAAEAGEDSSYDFDELLVHADVLVAAGREDASTTAIAWAMAAGVPVIAAATRANAELIAHKVGGLLYKPSRNGGDAPAIVRLLKDTEAQAKAKDVASGQAYEVFGLRRYIDQHAKLYENLLAGKAAAEGIVDPAIRT